MSSGKQHRLLGEGADQALHAGRPQRVHEHRRAQLLAGLEERLEARVADRGAVDVARDLDAGELRASSSRTRARGWRRRTSCSGTAPRPTKRCGACADHLARSGRSGSAPAPWRRRAAASRTAARASARSPAARCPSCPCPRCGAARSSSRRPRCGTPCPRSSRAGGRRARPPSTARARWRPCPRTWGSSRALRGCGRRSRRSLFP